MKTMCEQSGHLCDVAGNVARSNDQGLSGSKLR
jgi:hypothetical protein